MTILIHIAGTTGSGKTTLGKKIKEKYPFLKVVDLDDFHANLPSMYKKEFLSLDRNSFYKLYLEKGLIRFVKEHEDQSVVLVGFNGTGGFKTVNKYIDIPAKHKFYIDIPENVILRQRFNRYVDYLNSHREEYFQRTLKKPLVIDFDVWLKKIRHVDLEYYRSNHYHFANNVEIFCSIEKLIDAKTANKK